MITQERKRSNVSERFPMNSLPLTHDPSKKSTMVTIDLQGHNGKAGGSPTFRQSAAAGEAILQENVIIAAREFSFLYGSKVGVEKITLDIEVGSVTAIIGPSGCGKSTFLRCINRMNDLIPCGRAEGVLAVGGQNVYDKRTNLVNLRQEVGMVFQQPNPFAKTIYDNISYGPRLQGIRKKADLDIIAEQCLKDAALWDEVKDDLRKSAWPCPAASSSDYAWRVRWRPNRVWY